MEGFNQTSLISITIPLNNKCWYCDTRLDNNMNPRTVVYLDIGTNDRIKVYPTNNDKTKYRRWCSIACEKIESSNSGGTKYYGWMFPPFAILTQEWKRWYQEIKHIITDGIHIDHHRNVFVNHENTNRKINLITDSPKCLNCLVPIESVKLSFSSNSYPKYNYMDDVGSFCSDICVRSMIRCTDLYISKQLYSIQLPPSNRSNLDKLRQCIAMYHLHRDEASLSTFEKANSIGYIWSLYGKKNIPMIINLIKYYKSKPKDW